MNYELGSKIKSISCLSLRLPAEASAKEGGTPRQSSFWIPACRQAGLLAFCLAMTIVFLGGVNHASASMFTRAPNNFGMVGYWSMEDGKGATVTDFSGRGNTGTMTNMDPATDWVTGKVGKALDFDGTDDRVVIGGPSTIYGLTTDLSVFAWVKTTDTQWGAFSNGAGDNGGWCISSFGSVGAAGRLSTHIAGAWRFSSTAVNDGTWHHVGYTLSSSGGGTLQFYLDGVADGSAITSSGAHSGGGGTSITIGNEQGAGFPLSGQVDDARIYNRVLSASDVLALYGQTKITRANRQTGSLATNLVSYWKLDETSGARNDSFGSNNLTDNNTVTSSAGKIDNGATFVGANSEYLTKSYTSSLDFTTGFSISIWYKPTNGQGTETLAAKWDYGDAVQGWAIQTNGIYFNSAAQIITHGTSHTIGAWNHIVYIYDGTLTGDSNRLKMYLNGVAQTLTFNGISIPATMNNSPNQLVFGQFVNLGRYYSGDMDEVSIWSRALTASEVGTLYNSGNARRFLRTVSMNKSTAGAPGTSNLVLWHTFDGNKLNTTTSTDSSASGYNGTLSGGPIPVVGKVGQAMKFDATDDYVDLGSTAVLTSGSPFSISWWEKITSNVNSYPTRFELKINGTSNYFLLIRATGSGYDPFTWGSVSAIRAAGGSPSIASSVDVWHHFVLTGTDPSSGTSGNYSFYSDGVSLGTTSGGGWAVSANTNRIGYAGQNDPTNAIMDDVRVYNKVLTASEVLSLYNQSK